MLRNPGAVVYGMIAVGSILAAESTGRESYAATVGAVVIALLAYSIAHAYAEFAQDRLERKEPLSLDGLGRNLVRGLMIDVGAAIPLLVLLVCWITGAALNGAVTAAIWTSAGMIVLVELVAGLRAELSGRALILQTAIGALFGVFVIGLKLVLH
jgi:hypothetical protein